MLPVAHQACTLATGALRSSFTIKVRPSGKTHFFAVFAGKVMMSDRSPFIAGFCLEGGRSTEAAFRLTMVKTNAETSPATLTRYTVIAHLIPNQRRRSIRKFSALANPGGFQVSFRAQTAS